MRWSLLGQGSFYHKLLTIYCNSKSLFLQWKYVKLFFPCNSYWHPSTFMIGKPSWWFLDPVNASLVNVAIGHHAFSVEKLFLLQEKIKSHKPHHSVFSCSVEYVHQEFSVLWWRQESVRTLLHHPRLFFLRWITDIISLHWPCSLHLYCSLRLFTFRFLL